ncbi:hypothetical protein PT974_07301 [Cladobotryum mycophilum]|uniref:Uncharacterized protein n=1 Tax=Cladobotryum mycophilum TaxID=491253 RepID=A0ABR0SNW3_9HYPO
MSIISPLDEAHLLSLGLLGPESNGMRSLYKTYTNRSSWQEYGFMSLDSADSFTLIPDKFISEATLLYFGFSPERAHELWMEWEAGDPERNGLDMVNLYDLALDYADTWDRLFCVTADDGDEEWYCTMEDCGISDQLQEAIMDPIFENVRNTKSCFLWITETITSRFDSLMEIQTASKEREAILQTGSIPTWWTPPQGRFEPSIGAITAKKTPFLSWDSCPFFTAFKVLDLTSTEGLFDQDGSIDDITKLISRKMCTLRVHGGYSFVADEEFATSSAAYAKRRDENATIMVVSLIVARSALATIPQKKFQEIYWPATKWKKLVYHRRRTTRKHPPSLKRFKQATLIVGTMALCSPRAFTRLTHYREITEAYVAKTSRGPVTEVCWSRERHGERFLLQHGRFSASILTWTEYKAWMIDQRQVLVVH